MSADKVNKMTNSAMEIYQSVSKQNNSKIGMDHGEIKLEPLKAKFTVYSNQYRSVMDPINVPDTTSHNRTIDIVTPKVNIPKNGNISIILDISKVDLTEKGWILYRTVDHPSNLIGKQDYTVTGIGISTGNMNEDMANEVTAHKMNSGIVINIKNHGGKGIKQYKIALDIAIDLSSVDPKLLPADGTCTIDLKMVIE